MNDAVITSVAEQRKLFANYRVAPNVYDEALTADGQVRPTWQRFCARLEQVGLAGVGQRADQARRLLRENGVTYNDVGAPQGPDRPWELDPLPVLIGRAEWTALTEGIVQRAVLLNAFLADIYGPQRLLREKILPPAVVYEHPGFLHPCRGLTPLGGRHLTLYAANLIRGADGAWCVLADRTQGPSGVGYALENRIVISRTLPRDYESLYIERLAPFFITVRETLRGLAPRHRDNPRVVLLSPGPRSTRYFEDGYLARYLGYALVEGGDLTVRGEHVFLKTLGGLMPVDVILRRIFDEDCDALELRPDSSLGTPGLMQAARFGNLALANAAGSGYLEAPALMPFWPRICQFLLSEDLKLPCSPTMWCGRPDDLRQVERELDNLLIRPAFIHQNLPPVDTSRMAQVQRQQLWQEILAHPHRFVAKRPDSRSTAPTWNGRELAPARLVLRTFGIASGDSYQIMPGGLCRVADPESSWGESASSGQSSKDVWVLSDGPVQSVTLLPRSTTAVELRRSINDLPSRVADNLFWLGRNAERAEAVVRMLRSCVVRLTSDLEPTGIADLVTLIGSLPAVKQSLVAAKGNGKIVAVESDSDVNPAIAKLREQVFEGIFNPQRRGSLAQHLHCFRDTATSVRDRLSVDSWRIVNQLRLEDALPPTPANARMGDVLLLLNQVLNLLAAFMGLGTESMTRSPGWRFLDIGRRIERALKILHLVRSSLVEAVEPISSLLEAVLEIADCSMTYRHRYLASLQLAPLLDLVLVDETNPRAVGYQLNALSEHVAELPSDSGLSPRTPEQRTMLAAQSALRLTDVEALCEIDASGKRMALDRFIDGLETQLLRLAEDLTHHYLTHTVAARQIDTALPN